jgi:hypothetical protein
MLRRLVLIGLLFVLGNVFGCSTARDYQDAQSANYESLNLNQTKREWLAGDR